MALGLVPPSACPIPFADLMLSWHNTEGKGGSVEQFCALVASRVGKRYAFAFNHARTAIALLLQELHQMYPEKNEVVVPAYTCFTVAAAVARAGLVLAPADIDPSCFCYKREALLNTICEGTLAVIVVHPFGMPCDVHEVREVVGKRDIFVLEDCAQAWDTKYRGKPLGNEGDASIFSFGRGKHLNLGGGGICCLDDSEVAFRLKRRLESLPRPSRKDEMKRFLQMVYTAIGQHPSIYAYATRLPFLGIGETYFEPSFPMGHWSEWQARLGLRMLPRWQRMAEHRKRNADFWQNWMTAHPALGKILETDDSMDIAYLRMPVLCERRAEAMRWFRKQGIHAQKMYPATLTSIGDPRLKIRVYSSIEGARFVAERLYTLPVHPLFDARRWCTHYGSVSSARQEEVEVASTVS